QKGGSHDGPVDGPRSSGDSVSRAERAAEVRGVEGRPPPAHARSADRAGRRHPLRTGGRRGAHGDETSRRPLAGFCGRAGGATCPGGGHSPRDGRPVRRREDGRAAGDRACPRLIAPLVARRGGQAFETRRSRQAAGRLTDKEARMDTNIYALEVATRSRLAELRAAASREALLAS